MKTKQVPISQVSIDPHNPRTITKEKFEELKQSIIDFPEMQLVKPLIVADGLVIGGNMRLLAFKDLRYREVHIIDVTAWTQAKRDEFMIRDNTHYGAWDYDALANEWDTLPLTDWGLEVWQSENEPEQPDLDFSDKIEQLFRVEIVCNDESHQESIYNEMTKRGIECRILTL